MTVCPARKWTFAAAFAGALVAGGTPAHGAPITITHRTADHGEYGQHTNCRYDGESGEVTLKPLLDERNPVEVWQAETAGDPPWELVHRFAQPVRLKGIRTRFPGGALFECCVFLSAADGDTAWALVTGPLVARGDTVFEWETPVRARAVKTVVVRSAPFGRGRTHVSDLDPLAEEASFRKYRKDTNVYGDPLVIGDTAYRKGLGCHAYSELLFALDGKYSAFETDIGLNDTARRSRWGYVVFRILLDGETAFESPLLSWRDPPMHVGIVTRGAERLTLIMDPGLSGSEPANRTDHASWGNPVLLHATDGEAPGPEALEQQALGIRYPAAGSYLSVPIGTGTVKAWRTISWAGRSPPATSLALEVRSGDKMDTSDASWSSWSAPVGEAGVIPAPPGRYLQYRARFRTDDPAVTPSLASVSIGFDDGGVRERNAASHLGICHIFASEYDYDVLCDFARRAGIRLHRTSFDWDRIEWRQGRFDWERMDDQMNILAAHDIGSLGLLWTDLPPNYSVGSHARPGNLEDWGRFVEAVVGRYGEQIERWELWNEPDTGFYKGTLDEYRDLLKATYRAAKKADPDCLVSCGGMTPLAVFGWFRGLCEKGGWDAFDAIAYHPYTDADPPEHRIERFVHEVRRIEAEYGSRKRLWFTESGWQAGGGWLSARDEEQKAAYTVRNYLATIANGVDFTLIYRMATVEPELAEADFGLLDSVPLGTVFSAWKGREVAKLGRLSPKPAFHALQTALQWLEGAEYRGQFAVGDVHAAPGDGIHHRSAYAYVFENPDGPVVACCAYKEEDQGMFVLNTGSAQARLLDMHGRVVTNAAGNGSLCVPLETAPVYVVGAEPRAVSVRLAFEAERAGTIACSGGRTTPFAIIGRNGGLDDLSGTLLLEMPEGWEVHPAFLPVSLEPGQRERFVFEIRPLVVQQDATVTARFEAGTDVFPAVARARLYAYDPRTPLRVEPGEERVLAGRNRSVAVALTSLEGRQTGRIGLTLPPAWRQTAEPVPFEVNEGETRTFTLGFVRDDLAAHTIAVEVTGADGASLSEPVFLSRQYEWSRPADGVEVLYLCDLTPVRSETGHGELLAPVTMKIRDREYSRAVYAHANSRVRYSLPDRYRFFESDIGIRAGAASGGTARFEIHVNGSPAYRSPLITRADPAPVHVGLELCPVPGKATRLTLITTDAGDGKTCDWTLWGDPRALSDSPQSEP